MLLWKEIYELMFKQKHKMFPYDNRMKDVRDISEKEVRIDKNPFGTVLAFTGSVNLDIRELLQCLPGSVLCPHRAFSARVAH